MENNTPMDRNLNLWLLIRDVRDNMMKLRREELSSQGVTPQQSHVLGVIYTLGEDVTLKQISKNLSRKIHTISSQITRMEKRGLLNKIRVDSGTNRIGFEITEKGLEVYNFSRKREAMYKLMSVITEEERQTLVTCLNKLLNQSEDIIQELQKNH
jgi:DNA-binding MarR family transcriptional regulator